MDKVTIRHFTNAPEIQHFAVEKVSANDNVYGVTWGNVVKEYLRTGYKFPTKENAVEIFGKIYHVLDRGEVTAFYDKDGNTLFDVENTRLEREYQMIKEEEEFDAGSKSEIEKAVCEPVPDEKPEVEMGTASLADSAMGLQEPTAEKIKEAEKENEMPLKEKAVQKLKKEKSDAKNKDFAEPIIGYLIKRCEEDSGLAEDVMQKHKTWYKCFDYIYGQARKQKSGNCVAIRDDVVYEWAEDYYHKDDKAEEEEKARKEAERKEKQKKEAAERAAKAKKKSSKAVTAPEKKADAPKEQPKPKKNNRDMDGQLDMFSMMGM